MSKKTLNQIGEDDKKHYSDFQSVAQWRIRADKMVQNPWSEQEIAEAREDEHYSPKKMRRDNERAPARQQLAVSEYNDVVTQGKKFASEHAGELHDLALIEAHLGGIAINVEQPLEIGQKIEVHTSKKQ